MRIALLAAGSLGDVLPYTALAKGLVARGHRVRFATSPFFKPVLDGTGVEPFALGGASPNQVWSDLASNPPTRNPTRFLKHLFVAQRGLRPRLRELTEACRGTDVVVCSTATSPAAYAAEHFGLPVVQCHLSPLEPSTTYPKPIGPMWAHRSTMCGPWNWLTHAAMSQLFWSAVREEMNAWLTEDLGLPELPRTAPVVRGVVPRNPVLFGFSTAVLPRPVEWPEHFRVTGYWFDPTPPAWEPPTELLKFLARPGPVAAVGFGSSTADSRFVRDVVIEGALSAGLRVVFSAGWTDAKLANDERVLMLDYVPYSWLFPRVTVVVHHCGAGTAAEALRAGVRTVLLPFTGEQRFWAHRLHKATGSPKPVDPRATTAAAFAGRLRQALTDDRHGVSVARTSLQVSSEAGITSSAAVIERCGERG